MILLVAFLLVVATVPLLGGHLTRIATVDLRATSLLLGATVVQAVITQLRVDVPTGATEAAHIASYLLAGGFVWANRQLPWLWLAALGGALNFVVIVANGGVMPASPGALALAGQAGTGSSFANSALVESPRLAFLGDVFAVPASWPLSNVFSVGDVVLLVGAALLIHRIAGSRLPGPVRGSDGGGSTGGRLALVRENRDFRSLWLAGATSDLGDWTYSLAVIAVLALQGASSTVFATLIAVQMLASSIVGVLGTPIVDRVDRIRLLTVVNLVQAATVSTLLLPDEPAVAHLVVVGGLLGGLGALVRPATMASIPGLVRREELVSANGYVAAAFNVAVSLGPVIGAGVVSAWGARPAFLLNIGSFLLSAVLMAQVRQRHVPAEVDAEPDRERWFVMATAGLRHIVGRPPLRGLVVLMVFVVLGAALRAPVEPRFIVNRLGGSAGAIGALASLWGLGMVLGSTVAAAAGRRWSLERVLVSSVAVLGLCVLSASWLAVLAPVAVLWLLAGSANALGSVAYESLLQQRTPDGLRGRVFGAAEAALDVTYLAGAVAAGAIGPAFGSRTGVGVAGAAVLVAAAYGGLFFLRRPTTAAAPERADAPAAVASAP